MNYNFTDRVRKATELAREEAIRMQHDYIGTEHILLGLIRLGEGAGLAVLTKLVVDLKQVQERIEESVRPGKATIALGGLPYTSRAKKVLEFAMAEARELNHAYVGTEHLLMGLLREEKGIAAEVLNQLGVTLDMARRRTLELLGTEPNAGRAATPSPATGSEAAQRDPSSPTPEQIAEAFSRHNFEAAARYFADDVAWDIVGEERLIGREIVVERCQQAASYLAAVSTKFTRFRLLSAGASVVVDSTAEYATEGLDTSVVASCDIYRFAGGKIAEITSYNIEVGPG